jgi:hypothetical protein
METGAGVGVFTKVTTIKVDDEHHGDLKQYSDINDVAASVDDNDVLNAIKDYARAPADANANADAANNDDDESLKRSINDRLDKMINESGARAAWASTEDLSKGAIQKGSPPLLIYDYKPVTFRPNIMPPDLLRPPEPATQLEGKFIFSSVSSSQSADFHYDDDDNDFDAAWEKEDAEEEYAAKPLDYQERLKTYCGGRIADDAGHVPRKVSIASCLCGLTEGDTITLWGPPIRKLTAPPASALLTMQSHLTVIDTDSLRRKISNKIMLPYNPSFQVLRRRAWPRACVLGPDWPILCLTYFLILTPSCIWLALVTTRLHRALFYIGLVSLILLVLALAFTAGSDPGIVPKQTPGMLLLQKKRIARAAELAERKKCGDETHYRPGVAGAMALSQYSTCSICNVLRDYGTSHCTSCNTCCLELDHHCPWTGHCIGKGNLAWFFVFVYSLGIHIALVVASTIALFATGKYDQVLTEGGI